MERDPPGGSDVGRDLERDLGDEPPAPSAIRAPDYLAPIDDVGAGQRPLAGARGDRRRRSTRPSTTGTRARDLHLPGVPAGRDAGPRDRDASTATSLAAHGRQSHAQPLLDDGPAGLPVVYTIDAGAYDIVVNGDHLLSWGVEPAEIQDAAMRNLGRWSATRAVDRRDLRRPPADQLGHRRRLGRRPDPAARGRRAPRRASSAPHGRILIGLPERHLLTAGLAAPGRRRTSRRSSPTSSSSSRAAPTSRSTGASSSSWTAGSSSSTGSPPPDGRRPTARRRPSSALRFEVADAIATITLDRPDALNALTVPMKARAAGGVPGRRPRPVRPGGRADRRRPGVLRRPGPQGAARARTRRRSPSSCASATTRSSGRCARSTSRSSGRSTASRPAPARRSRSPATSGSPPSERELRARVRADRARARQRRDVVPAAARRAGEGRRAGARSATRCRAADAERFGLVAAVVPARRRWPTRRGRSPTRLAGLAPRRPRLDQARARAEPGRSTSTRRSRTRRYRQGDRRRHGGPRRGHGRVPREAAAAVHRGVAPARALIRAARADAVGSPLTSVS